MENQTKFLDILFNESFIDFDVLIKKVLTDLNLAEYGYSYFKKKDNYIIEVEKDNQLISLLFNDYFMVIRESRFRTTRDISEYWNKLIKQSELFKFILKPKQKAEYNRNLKDYQFLSKNSDLQEEELIQKELNF